MNRTYDFGILITELFRTATRKVVVGAWIGAAMLGATCLGAAFDGRLSLVEAPDGVDVAWTSTSLTPAAPFLHYEFQVQHSADLVAWENSTTFIPGGFLGSASLPHTFRLLTTATHDFVRLSYRLNMPGADLSGLDLSGADLTGAELTGANLAGADLSGAILDGAILGGTDLTGANLDGATFAGADLQDVNLDGIDLTGVDLSGTVGTPILTQVTADPAGNAGELVPDLAYDPAGGELVADDAVVPGIVSTHDAMVMLTTNATVGELNTLLAAHGASIVASSSADETSPNAVLMARFPTANAQELYDLTVALNDESIVEAAAPDVLIGLDIIPADQASASSWKWDVGGSWSGGNWGLEHARVPQMWNVLPNLQQNGASPVWTCVIDNYFQNGHPDLRFASLLGPTAPTVDDHGMHVAGIIGAHFDNDTGIDGVNPMAALIGYTMVTLSSDYPASGSLLDLFEPGRQANAYRMVQDVRDLLRQVPHAQILNMSLGYNWYLATNAARPNITDPFSSSQLDIIEFMAQKYGTLMASVANAAPSVLIVCSAGNSSNLTPARFNSPMATAALDLGVPNIIVVEAHDIAGTNAAFSNLGGHVAAPGTDILSVTTNAYAAYSGTSMAAPFVAGVAGFLKAVDPTLDPPTLISLLQRNGPNVDAFTSLMEIDELPGRNHKVLRMLLDIDDSSPDGSLRVRVPAASVNRDRSFEEVTGPDYNDLNHVAGDEVIDMSDFRRWRDWLLFGLGANDLNGSTRHLKFDGNADLTVSQSRDMTHHPRGDFNGDGKLDERSERLVPGWSQPLTDLEVLVFSELDDVWEDPDYDDASVLFDLVDSVDFHVSATNFYYKHSDIDAEVDVSVYDVETEAPLEDGAAILFSPDSTEHIFTVPTDGEYFVASDPIPIGEGTNVVMRSIGDQEIAAGQRGADFAVDLALWEMTAVAKMLNPETNLIDSRALAKYVEAYIPAGGGTSSGGQSEEEESVGARAWATNTGTFYALARAGSLPFPATNVNVGTTWSSTVRWQRSFIKDASKKDPRFLVKPMRLSLGGTGPGGTELNALAEIVVEMRSYDISAAWQPVFFYRAEIAGKAASGGNPHTFRIVEQIGDLPDKALQLNGTFGAEYLQEKHRGRINLEDVPDGHSFEVRYRLYAEIVGQANDNETLAYVGDPLEYGSGTRMVYGEFGDLPDIDTVTIDLQGNGVVSYYSHTNFYYRLYRGADADTTGLPIAMKLGIGGPDMLIDPAPPPGATPDDYTLENQPIDQPLDLDGDGIDDVYELRRAAILDPLDTADSFLDPDGDGRSNLREYLDGTDPEVADGPPSSPTLNFPGLLVPSYPGGDLVDINNDGLLDSAIQNLSIALGHLGGTFAEEITSPITGMRTVGDAAYIHLDGDAFPDAVLTDSLTNVVFLFQGVGDGTFTPLTNHTAISGATKIVPCDLNGDAFIDVALMSRNARGADLHVNNGDGTLAPLATLTTNAFGVAQGLAMGDLNNDAQDDVVVGYVANLVVFLSQSDGSYADGQPYPVGSTPASIAIADLNADGFLDVVAANQFSDNLSVLLGASGGALLPQVTYETGELPLALRLADVNEDTFLDAVVSLGSADYQTILLGMGDGTFDAAYTVAAGTSLSAIHDWDGDGHLDLVSSISSAGGLVILGNGDGSFDTRLQIVPPDGSLTQVSPVDFNGDGQLELIGLNTQANSIDVWEHAAVTGTSSLLSSTVVGEYVEAFAPGDFDGDGLVDVAVTTEALSFNTSSSNQVVILINQGNATFQAAGHYPMSVRPTRIVSGDFNGDGDVDLAVHIGGGTLFGGSQLVSLLGDGSGGFQTGTPVVVGDVVTFMAAVDSNGDLVSEVLIYGFGPGGGGSGGSFLDVFAVDGSGGWTTQQSLAYTSNPLSLQLASINGDAYPDLVVTQTDPSTGDRSLRMYPGGTAGFGPEEVLESDVEFVSFTRLADLNNDGLLDVASANTLFVADPNGGFYPGQSIWIGAQGVQGVADFNRDGKPDLLNGLSILLQE